MRLLFNLVTISSVSSSAKWRACGPSLTVSKGSTATRAAMGWTGTDAGLIQNRAAATAITTIAAAAIRTGVTALFLGSAAGKAPADPASVAANFGLDASR